jgi:hypothetical protein
MREKLLEYLATDNPGWPLTGHILDPVRCSVVVQTCGQMLEILSWLRQPEDGVTICKIKNKYAAGAVVPDGYRDLAVNVLFKGANGLKIIGEVQIHVKNFWFLKNHMHTLYKIKRAETPDAV